MWQKYERNRALIIDRYKEGLSYNQLAAKYSITYGRVDQIINEDRNKLAKTILKLLGIQPLIDKTLYEIFKNKDVETLKNADLGQLVQEAAMTENTTPQVPEAPQETVEPSEAVAPAPSPAVAEAVLPTENIQDNTVETPPSNESQA